MMRRLRRAAIVVIVASGLALIGGGLPGCATLPEPSHKTPVAADFGVKLLEEWLLNSARTRSIEGVAKVRVQTPERSVSGTQVLLADMPDRLRAETLSPFGTPLLVLTVNETELTVLVTGDNRVFRGRPSVENLGRFTRLPLRVVDLVGILLSRPPLIAYRDLQVFQLDDGGWQLALTADQRRQELRFDRLRRLAAVNYLYDGALQLHLTYGEFDGAAPSVPKRMELELPVAQIQAELVFRELATNRQFEPALFRLTPPTGALITDLDELATMPSAAPTGSN